MKLIKTYTEIVDITVPANPITITLDGLYQTPQFFQYVYKFDELVVIHKDYIFSNPMLHFEEALNLNLNPAWENYLWIDLGAKSTNPKEIYDLINKSICGGKMGDVLKVLKSCKDKIDAFKVNPFDVTFDDQTEAIKIYIVNDILKNKYVVIFIMQTLKFWGWSLVNVGDQFIYIKPI